MNNLERFWVATAPCVQLQAADHAFRLRDLWEALEEWSAYGVAVPLCIDDNQEVAQFYAPSLSALQLFAAAPPAAASGDASVPRLVFEYFERAPPFARKPLSDALADLAGGGSGGAELGTLSSADLHARSFVSVCWQPISRIPLGRAFRELTASFVTYHSLAPGGANLPPSCSPTVRQALAERLAEQGTGTATLLPAFGLLGLKMNADQWLEGGDPRLRTELDTACAQWMAPLAGRHSDYEFYRASQGAH